MVRPEPEPEGFRARAGFVKANPLNNDYYIQEWEGHPWYPAIKACHEELTAALPGYNIAQIKEKFGGLRYYIDMPPGESRPEAWSIADSITGRAERWVDEFENGTVR